MSRVYTFVPRISRHRVERMPHLVMLASGDPARHSRHLYAARGVLIGGVACAVFWACALTAFF